MRRHGLTYLCLLGALLLASSCATYTSRVKKARVAFERGNYETSINELTPGSEKEGLDQLLYLLDLGTVYYTAGQYENAIVALRKAEKIAEIKDYTSITTEAATVLLNDEVKSYKGEDFEKILINVYLALSYTMLKKWDEALVECRRVNHKLDLMIREGKLPYEKNVFAKYLAGALFEARREYNDAFVDYRQLLSWKVDVPYLGIPLLRMADTLRAWQELNQYKTKFPSITDYKIAKNQGEIIVIFEQGKAPVKIPTPGSRLLPMFRQSRYRYRSAEVNVAGKRRPTRVLFDIERTAMVQLEKKKAAMMAKKVGGVVVKHLVAKQVEKSTDSKLLGFLTSLVLHATDRADLRSWTTLPATLQLSRITVPTGDHKVVLDLIDKGGTVFKDAHVWPQVSVRPGERVFLTYRNSG